MVNDGGDEKFLKQRITKGEERGKKLRKKWAKTKKRKRNDLYYHNVNTACALQYVTN